jgi:H+/Cl- antiporter ClcA
VFVKGIEALLMCLTGLVTGALGALAYTLVTFTADEMMHMQKNKCLHIAKAVFFMLVGAEGGAGNEVCDLGLQ